MTVSLKRAELQTEKGIIGQYTQHVLRILKEVITDGGKHNVKLGVIWVYK